MINSSPLHFRLANIGDDVTLPCSCHGSTAIEYHWFKQGFGPSPQLVTKCYSLNDNGSFAKEFNNPRFSLDIKKSNYQLKISNVKFSDSATYFCLALDRRASDFCEGTTLAVKGSSFSVSTLVSESETIEPGEPRTLSCTIETLTCSGEHSVYWFRQSEGSPPGIIHAQRGSNYQCEGKSKPKPCVYNLPMKSQNLPTSGSYYCVIVACGHIMFGEGIKLDVKSE